MKITLNFKENCPLHQKALAILKKYQEYTQFTSTQAVVYFILAASRMEDQTVNVMIKEFMNQNSELQDKTEEAPEKLQDKPADAAEAAYADQERATDDFVMQMMEGFVK
ncbi:MAG: hypothetical protein LUH14_04035 [Clostridiaceae bacterium]|nr:hypothetical protein [Clostridiaceae bacterium]